MVDDSVSGECEILDVNLWVGSTPAFQQSSSASRVSHQSIAKVGRAARVCDRKSERALYPDPTVSFGELD